MNDVRKLCERRIESNQKLIENLLKGLEEMCRHYRIDTESDLIALKVNIDNRLNSIKGCRAEMSVCEEVLITMELEEERKAK